MKLFKYIIRNVMRNKLRSSLTVLSVAFSLALMTILYGYLAMQAAWGKQAQKHNRIVMLNRQGFSGAIPIAYVDRVRTTEGVVAAVPYSWFGGSYQDQPMPFAQFGTDSEFAFEVWDELVIDPAQLEAWQGNRQGCVVDRQLAERQKWKLGERIPLQGTFIPVALDLQLVGMFDAPQYTDTLWFHWQYLDEELKRISPEIAGNAGTIFAKCTSPGVIPETCESLDGRFASSDNPTRTETEAAFAQMFTDMLGNIQQYIRNISLAAIASLLLVAGSSMAMSMRERTTEVAVLKAIGFSKLRVLTMVLGEATVISLTGGLLGIGFGAFWLQLLHQVNSQFFPIGIAQLAGVWLLGLVAAAAAIGLASGLVPAVRAAGLSVVDGLRRVV